MHFQWLDLQYLDWALLPDRPLVLTAHDLLPREPRPGQAAAQHRLYDRVDAVVVHSDYGRRQLVDALGIPAGKVHVIRHGAFGHLARLPSGLPQRFAPHRVRPANRSAPQPRDRSRRPLRPPARPSHYFGLIRAVQGRGHAAQAWRGIDRDAELWIVGRPRMPIEPLRAAASASVRFVPGS